MGKKSDAAKKSLVLAFLAAGGAGVGLLAAGGATAAADPAVTATFNPESATASYFGPLGLEDNFVHYLKASTGFESFYKYYKFSPADATNTVLKFSDLNEIPPPPGFGETGDGGGIS
jgi:hypothetical protein